MAQQILTKATLEERKSHEYDDESTLDIMGTKSNHMTNYYCKAQNNSSKVNSEKESTRPMSISDTAAEEVMITFNDDHIFRHKKKGNHLLLRLWQPLREPMILETMQHVISFN